MHNSIIYDPLPSVEGYWRRQWAHSSPEPLLHWLRSLRCFVRSLLLWTLEQLRWSYWRYHGRKWDWFRLLRPWGRQYCLRAGFRRVSQTLIHSAQRPTTLSWFQPMRLSLRRLLLASTIPFRLRIQIRLSFVSMNAGLAIGCAVRTSHLRIYSSPVLGTQRHPFPHCMPGTALASCPPECASGNICSLEWCGRHT